MATVRRSTGVRLDIPETYEIVRPSARRRRGAERGAASSGLPPAIAAIERDDVLAALADELQQVDVIELNPTVAHTDPSGSRPATRGPAPGRSPVHIEVDLGSDESAILLLEQDGVYSWVIGNERPPPRRRRRGGPSVGKTVVFEV